MIDNVLICYGVCTVAEDKQTNTNEVFVYLPLLFPDADGEVKSTVETVQATTTSPTGDTHSSTGLRNNSVGCEWMNLNSNRITAPDVRSGSKVVVYKYKGTNKYLWTYAGMDATLRLETVIWAFSASPKVNEDIPFDTDHYYILMISSHQKKFQFLTGQGNGEATSYAFTLDMGEGGFSFADGEENSLTLNSMEHVWAIMNQEQSVIAMDKKNISITCDDQIFQKATESINMSAKIINLKATEALNINVGKQTNLISPKIYVEGDITHVGDNEQTGNYKQTGSTTTTGSVTADGTVTGKSGVKTGKVDVDSHDHGNVQNGNGRTAPASG